MIEVIALGLAMAFAGYLITPRSRQRVSRDDLPRYRRMAEETRRIELHRFE